MKTVTTSAVERDGRIIYEECPLCGCVDIPAIKTVDCSQHPLYHPQISPKMTWRRCLSCGHVFTDGYFTDESLKLIFSRTHAHQSVGHDAEKQRMISAHIVQRVTAKVRLSLEGGSWLDVGFGNGSLLMTAAEWGFRPVGTDLRSDCVNALKQFGYDAMKLDIGDVSRQPWMGNSFSVVSMADVLEHMPHPKVALDAAHWLLDTNGVLFVSMPNAGCALWNILTDRDANPYWGEIEHYHNFTRERLYSLLEECGFQPVEYNVSERYRVCMEVIAIKK